MPNSKGGKKFKKGKKNNFYDSKLIYKDPKEDQEYAKIIRAMGNGRFELECFDGKNRIGIIAGNMRKRKWINKDDIILFSKWEFSSDDNKCSIIHKYSEDEVKKLEKENEFPKHINLYSNNEFIEEYNDISIDYISQTDSDNENDRISDESDLEQEIDLNEI
tara:strand:+ start:1741 stop:2226 length:486 start_codon:yes stop_codon:yes gene_type:complete